MHLLNAVRDGFLHVHPCQQQPALSVQTLGPWPPARDRLSLEARHGSSNRQPCCPERRTVRRTREPETGLGGRACAGGSREL